MEKELLTNVVFGVQPTYELQCFSYSNTFVIHSSRLACRVKIDEKGVTAASYIELNFGAGAAEPPDEIIDFVLDRPFVFVVSREQIPLFVGTVNQP